MGGPWGEGREPAPYAKPGGPHSFAGGQAVSTTITRDVSAAPRRRPNSWPWVVPC
jgi:hypothetical protein